MAYVTTEALRAALKVPAGASVDDALNDAANAASTVIDTYTGTSFATPVPPEIEIAALQIASRIYRSGDVAFGVIGGEFGTAFTGRWITPEVEMLLIGKRQTFGIG